GPRFHPLEDRAAEAPTEKVGMDVAVGVESLVANEHDPERRDASVELPEPGVPVEVDAAPVVENVLRGRVAHAAPAEVVGHRQLRDRGSVLRPGGPDSSVNEGRAHRASPEEPRGLAARAWPAARAARRGG